jgi:hypothetical protein
MRTLTLLALVLVGCGKKSPVEASTSQTATAVAPPPPIAAQPEPEPEPEPEGPVNNVSLQVEVTRMDGSAVKGTAIRLERGQDWYAEDGWTSNAKDLTLSLETDSDMKDVAWSEVARIDISYGAKGDIDCLYDSNFMPWMYMCTLRTQPTAKLKDGSSWRITSRHQWRLTLDDDQDVSFYLFRLPAREQDEKSSDLSPSENYALYGKLQTRAMELARTSAVKSIVLK